MLEPSHGARFAHEPDRERRRGGEPQIHDFHGHVAPLALLPDTEHRGEPTFAQQRADGKFISEGLLQPLAQCGDVERHGGRET